MEFWIFVADPNKFENNFVNIIYIDFKVISFIKTKENLLDVYCIPLEHIYKFSEDVTLIKDENYINCCSNILTHQI